MNITLDHNDILMLLLRGAWFDCTTVPKDLAEKLKQQAGDLIHIESGGNGASFYNLWTKEGWENELKRRLYIISVKEPPRDHWMQSKVKPEQESIESLKKKLTKAALAGDIDLMQDLTTKIQKYENPPA